MRHLRRIGISQAVGQRLASLAVAGALSACGGATATGATTGAASPPAGTGAATAAATGAPANGTTPTSTAPSSGSSVARAADGAVNACALMPAAAIQAAIGTSVVEAVPYGDAECRWRVEPLPAFPGATDTWVDVQFFANDIPMTHVEAAPDTGGVTAVDGLGDRAFRTNSFHHLWVKHGSDVYVVRSRMRSLSDTTDASRTAGEAIEVLLARAVLAQL